MDAEHVEQVAERLAVLGCTQEQIERHVKPLRSAAARAAQLKPRRTPTTTYELTQDQIDLLLAKLRERQWRWVIEQTPKDTGEWVGHTILAVTGMPDPKSNASFLVGYGATIWMRTGRQSR